MLDPADLAKLARPSMEDGKSEAACVEKVFQSVWGAGVGGFENGGFRVSARAWCLTFETRRSVTVRKCRCPGGSAVAAAARSSAGASPCLTSRPRIAKRKKERCDRFRTPPHRA
jgi:hypothetical protein